MTLLRGLWETLRIGPNSMLHIYKLLDREGFHCTPSSLLYMVASYVGREVQIFHSPRERINRNMRVKVYYLEIVFLLQIRHQKASLKKKKDRDNSL